MKVNYTVKCFASGTNTQITSIKVGQKFDLVLLVQDLRPAGTYFNPNYGLTLNKARGVFAAYTDILFNQNLVQVNWNGGWIFSPQYPNGQFIQAGLNRIDEVGAFASSFSGLGTGLIEVVRIDCTGRAVGINTFTPSCAKLERPMHDTLVYGNIACDPPEQSYVDVTEITLTPVSISVTL